jgi:glutamine amidotransferase
MKKRVVIVDYDLGNLFSVQLACEAVGLEVEISSDQNKILASDGIILPGVGSFKAAMNNLDKLDLVLPIRDFALQGKPIMGVCLGMQLLFEGSEEFGNAKGLNIIPGEIRKLKSSVENFVKIPQIGWNMILPHTNWEKTPFKHLKANSYMYFVHSFFATPSNPASILSTTAYGDNNYCSSVHQGNIFATQFHPEKSTAHGIGIYRQWGEQHGLIE